MAFNWGLFLWTEAMFMAWLAILLIVVPKLEDVFRDFHVQIPLAMKLLIDVGWLMLYGGFVVVLALPVGIGFLGGVLEAAGRRIVRMIITVVMASLIVFTVVALFQPLITLVEGVSSHR